MFARIHRWIAAGRHVWRSILLSGVAAACLAAACLAAGACAVHHAEPGAVVDLSVISEREIDSVHASDAFETIKRLRPMFLMTRGKLTFDPTVPATLPNVYVDNQLYGDMNALRSIASSTIESIRYYNASEAQYKFGRGNDAGVIGIITRH